MNSNYKTNFINLIKNYNDTKEIFEADYLDTNLENLNDAFYIRIVENYHVSTSPIKREVVAYVFEANVNYEDISKAPKFNLENENWEQKVKDYALKFDISTSEKLVGNIYNVYNIFSNLNKGELMRSYEYNVIGENDVYKWEIEQAHTRNKERGVYFATLTHKLIDQSVTTIFYSWVHPVYMLTPNSNLNYENVENRILNIFTNAKQKAELKLLFLEALEKRFVSGDNINERINEVKEELKAIEEAEKEELKCK